MKANEVLRNQTTVTTYTSHYGTLEVQHNHMAESSRIMFRDNTPSRNLQHSCYGPSIRPQLIAMLDSKFTGATYRNRIETCIQILDTVLAQLDKWLKDQNANKETALVRATEDEILAVATATHLELFYADPAIERCI